jgi:hypothetical protein
MLWVLTILLIAIYILALPAILLFFAGAARVNERWDRTNIAIWQRGGRFQSGGQPAA